MSAGVEVVGSVVTVIEAVTIRLEWNVSKELSLLDGAANVARTAFEGIHCVYDVLIYPQWENSTPRSDACFVLVARIDIWKAKTGLLTEISSRVMLDLKSESGSTSSTKACCPQLPTIIPIRICTSGMINTNDVARKSYRANAIIVAYEDSSETAVRTASCDFRFRRK